MNLNEKSFSEFFTRDEVKCNCGKCSNDTGDWVVTEIAEDLHRHYDSLYGRVYIHVNSWNRCIDHNEYVQKKNNPNYIPYSSKSKHLEGKAIDITIYYWKNKEKIYIDPLDIHNYLCKKYPDKFGFICYKTFNHIDSRSTKWRDIK